MRQFLLSFFVLLSPTLSYSQVEMVVQREDWRLTLYVSVPLDLVETVFGASITDDSLPLDASAIANGLGLRTADGEIELVPVSGGLHPSSDPMNFEAPWDASTAIQFSENLTELDPEGAYTVFAQLERTDFNAWSPMTLFFPRNSETIATIKVREFVRDQVRDSYLRQFDENPIIQFQDVRPSRTGVWLTMIFGAIFLSAMAFDWFRRKRRIAVEESDLKR